MVSVIIPIYNVCNFIERGIQQILAQNYIDFEVILVDDGSTDSSYEKCQQVSQLDKRIRVLHQKNKGAGSARNLGIENATGEYIYFFDIDDEVASNLLEYNVHIMEKYDVEMVVFGYKNVETIYKKETEVSFPSVLLIGNESLKNVYVEDFILKVNGFPWNKFYRKEFLDKYKLRYENQRIQQDEVFNMMCYQHITRMYLSSECLYTYYIYNKGNTRSRFIPDRFDIYKSVRQHFEQLKSFWNLTDIRLDDYLNKRFYNGVLQCMQFNLLHSDCPWTMEQKQQEMKRIMSDPLTVEAFAYADIHYLDFEHKMYRNACRSESLRKLNALNLLFTTLRKLKRKVLRG